MPEATRRRRLTDKELARMRDHVAELDAGNSGWAPIGVEEWAALLDEVSEHRRDRPRREQGGVQVWGLMPESQSRDPQVRIEEYSVCLLPEDVLEQERLRWTVWVQRQLDGSWRVSDGRFMPGNAVGRRFASEKAALQHAARLARTCRVNGMTAAEYLAWRDARLTDQGGQG